MKPASPPPRGCAAKAAARTTLRARLGWLRGYPTGPAQKGALPWRVVPPLAARAAVRDHAVDRAALRAGTFALSALPRRFPRALERVVDDPRAWTRAAGDLLARLRACVHDGVALPATADLLSLARAPQALARDARRAVALRPLVDALAWVHGLEPAELEAALRVALAAARPLAVLVEHGRASGLDLALRLIDLAVAQPRAPGLGLLDVLGRPALWSTPLRAPHAGALRDLADALGRVVDDRGPARAAAAFVGPGSSAGDLVDMGLDLLASEPSARDAGLGLLAAVVSPPLVDAWAAWWSEVRVRVADARRDLARRPRAGVSRERRAALAEAARGLRRLSASAPPQVLLTALIAGVQHVGSAPREVADLLRETLALVPPLAVTSTSDLARLEHARELPCGPRPRVAAAALRVTRDVLRALSPGDRPGAPREGHSDRLLGKVATGLLPDLLELGAELPRLEAPLREALLELIRARCFVWADGYEAVDLLVGHVRLRRDGAAAAAFFRAAAPALAHVEWPLGPAALALSGLCATTYTRLTRALKAEAWPFDLAAALVQLAAREDLRALLVRALLGGDAARARRVTLRWMIARGFGAGDLRLEALAPAPPAPPAQPRPGACAPSLGALLEALRALDPTGARALERTTAALLPSRARLERELATLEALGAHVTGPRAAHLRARAARLRERLRADQPPAPRRLRALTRRLSRRVDALSLARWEASLAAAARRALLGFLGVGDLAGQASGQAGGQAREVEAWLACPRRTGVLAGLAGLPARWRPLTARVLRRRLGPAPWDLRDASPNAAFLDALRGGGVDSTPWLDGARASTWPAADEVLILRLEDDPLEVLNMGAPFRTCLSPGDINFFAALVDAADVNKRVLYARTREGTVVGRCLLGLTDTGGIVTYHPYCHDARQGFPAAARAFVGELARAMGTRALPAGQVPALLASEWYCDGPEDLTGALAFLAAGSAFRAALAGAAPADALALLEAAAAPRGVDAPVLERVLDLPELDERPELATAFVAQGLTLRLPARTQVRAVERLVAAGALEAARAVAARLRLSAVEPALAPALARALVALGRAHDALQLLRRTRRPGRTEDPRAAPDAARAEALGLACEALHRLTAARRHYAAAASARGPEDAVLVRCRARLDALATTARPRAG